MIGILGGMGTLAGLDFCNKLAKLNEGKNDQKYPLFILYNKSTIPNRTKNIKQYNKVFKSLLEGCKFLEKNKCKFIVMPCNTAHYWHDDLQKKTSIPIINMPEEVYLHAIKKCKINSKVGLLATQGTVKTGIYNKFFCKKFKLINPNKFVQSSYVDKAINLVKMGKIKDAQEAIKPSIDFLIKMKCSKIILGCTELPIAILTNKYFKNIKFSKIFLDANLILASTAMKKYNKKSF